VNVITVLPDRYALHYLKSFRRYLCLTDFILINLGDWEGNIQGFERTTWKGL
jgi:hypothetical protein